MSNNIEGIGQVELSVEDVPLTRKFFVDFGLKEINPDIFSTLNNSTIVIKKDVKSSINSITWNLDVDVEVFYNQFKQDVSFTDKIKENNTIECIDPSGLKIIFQKNQKKELSLTGVNVNSWNNITRVNIPVPKFQKINPIEIGHIVIETSAIKESEEFYKSLGFVVSDRLIGRGVFLRSKINSGHHDLFLVESQNLKLNHIAFTVKDIYELIAGGKIMESRNWKTRFGPGRHDISSAFFW
jgi:catechol 2,3-dioxygenase-like lactoylglutathione lyase family enzyme